MADHPKSAAIRERVCKNVTRLKHKIDFRRISDEALTDDYIENLLRTPEGVELCADAVNIENSVINTLIRHDDHETRTLMAGKASIYEILLKMLKKEDLVPEDAYIFLTHSTANLVKDAWRGKKSLHTEGSMDALDMPLDRLQIEGGRKVRTTGANAFLKNPVMDSVVYKDFAERQPVESALVNAAREMTPLGKVTMRAWLGKMTAGDDNATFIDLANDLGVPVGTIKSRMGEIRKKVAGAGLSVLKQSGMENSSSLTPILEHRELDIDSVMQKIDGMIATDTAQEEGPHARKVRASKTQAGPEIS